jgi:hypothetical protein
MQQMIVPTPARSGSVQKKTIQDSQAYSVYVTNNYDQFKIMADNRNVNLLHVHRLVESFKHKHLVSPIIVNEFLEVIDGQHRLSASKETGMPVHYIIIPGYGIDDVQILNTNQKNWTKLDYLHSYCAEGRRPYLELKKFMDDFPDFGIQSAERICTMKTFGKTQGNLKGHKIQIRDFEEGKLIIPSIQKSYLIARKLLEFKKFYPNYHRGTFVSAMLPLLTKSLVYNHGEMIKKLSTSPIKMMDCATVEAYRMLLEDIYNYKRQKENKISFRYE